MRGAWSSIVLLCVGLAVPAAAEGPPSQEEAGTRPPEWSAAASTTSVAWQAPIRAPRFGASAAPRGIPRLFAVNFLAGASPGVFALQGGGGVASNLFSTGPTNLSFGAEGSQGGELTGGSAPFAGVLSVASANALHLGTNNLVRFTIASGGNVGIGVQSPAQRLSVDGTIESTSGGYKFPDGTVQMTASGGGNQWTTAGSDLFYGAGNVGIGTSSPAAKLQVAGDTLVGGSIAATGNIVAGGNIAARFQDVAEWVDSTESLEAGTIVTIDPTGLNRVVASKLAYDARVAGAVSLQPGVILGDAGRGRVMIAQSGRVRVKVDARYSPIRAGDLLVTSPTPGHAMRSEPLDFAGTPMHRPGTVLGKALESLSAGQGEILVLVTLQ